MLSSLMAEALAGHTVLLLGPVGIGKSALLAELARLFDREGCPCGSVPETRCLGDVTEALARAYPGVSSARDHQRRRRGLLRRAVIQRPGVLLLDQLRTATPAMKRFLTSLWGTGLGVILAGDIEHARDRARIRGFGLAHRELVVPALGWRHSSQLLHRALATRDLPHPIAVPDRAKLLKVAQGRPGWILRIADRLTAQRYWRGGRICVEVLHSDLTLEVASRYLLGSEESSAVSSSGSTSLPMASKA
jgi:energy-coupling factor transporter ATP-binding protein EcfA2